ncbi:MAG: hypothetical protein JST00_45825 [Deltaproteobacteria bacterium]|nr:hypothetical protein [Deltaproteobacteria bacterium]
MLTLEEAKSLALQELARLGNTYELAFYDDDTQCKRYGWILFYNTRQYIETGDFLFSLGGNGPLVVLHDGTVHPLGTSKDVDATISEFEQAHGLS